VISELVAARPHPKVIEWIQSVDDNQIFLIKNTGITLLNPWE
jgi:hypothetical protein